jgi:hypothetical protein
MCIPHRYSDLYICICICVKQTTDVVADAAIAVAEERAFRSSIPLAVMSKINKRRTSVVEKKAQDQLDSVLKILGRCVRPLAGSTIGVVRNADCTQQFGGGIDSCAPSSSSSSSSSSSVSSSYSTPSTGPTYLAASSVPRRLSSSISPRNFIRANTNSFWNSSGGGLPFPPSANLSKNKRSRCKWTRHSIWILFLFISIYTYIPIYLKLSVLFLQICVSVYLCTPLCILCHPHNFASICEW